MSNSGCRDTADREQCVQLVIQHRSSRATTTARDDGSGGQETYLSSTVLRYGRWLTYLMQSP
jgi:hypothetical protein